MASSSAQVSTKIASAKSMAPSITSSA
jgi:hypothetical protein